VDGWDALAAQRLGRELELLDERRALAREEEAWRREEVRRLDGLAAQQWARAQAAGLDLPEPERSPAGGGLAWVARVVPLLEALGGGDASLAKLLAFLQQWKGVETMARGIQGRGSGPSDPADLARLLRHGDRGEALRMAQGQRLDRETVAFLRSLGLEAREGEEMTSALRRLARSLSSEQKAEVRAKASQLLDRLGDSGGVR